MNHSATMTARSKHVSQTAGITGPGQVGGTTGTEDGDHDPARADELRAAMVGRLLDEDLIQPGRVTDALATVPRHLFAPGESLEAAYAAHGAPMARRDADGLLTTVMSAPYIQAQMLEDAGIEQGMRVLEVGSGGFNAALMAGLARPGGRVTTVDIDPEVTARARACLDAAGYSQVRVVLADAEHGVPDGAPYDRIIVTAAACDIPPAWISQLAPDGRLVVPLRFRGLTRTVTFERDRGGLVSRHYRLAAFVPFQGEGAHADRKVRIRDGVVLHTDNPDLRINAPALNAALDTPELELWTGAKYDFPDEVSLFVTVNSPHVAQFHVSQEAVDAGIAGRRALHGVPAIITADSIAYRMARQVSDSPAAYESGVIAHGPQARSLAEQHADLLRRWDRDYYRRGTALFRYLPGCAAPDLLPPGGLTVAKRHGVLEVTYP
jgi:protein-L-isoaspartate(D-aspartate) O-methyltransferase